MSIYKLIELSKNRLIQVAFLLAQPLVNQGQWLVHEGYYVGNEQVAFSGEQFDVWSLNDSTLAFKASTFRKSAFFSDIYASYGTINKSNGLKVYSMEAPWLDKSSTGIFTSAISPTSFLLNLAMVFESEVTYTGSSLKNTFGCFNLGSNQLLWKQDGRLTSAITPFIERPSDTIIWMQKGSLWDTSSYLVSFNATNGDSLNSISISSFSPTNVDSNFSDYELRRSMIANDTFFVEFESVNFSTRTILGYPTARKWIKAYNPMFLENGAIDSVYYPDYNMDLDLLTPGGEGDDLFFYEYHDSIATTSADSGLKTFRIYNWKREWVRDAKLRLKVTRTPNSNWPEYLEAVPILQNGYTLISSPHLYGPRDMEYYGTRLVLFDSSGSKMYDVISDTTKPSWTMGHFYIDKTGDVYYQGVDPENYHFNSLGRILPNGQNYRTLPFGSESPSISLPAFQVYPNPVSPGGSIEVSALNGIEPAEILLYDVAGNLCFKDNGLLDSRVTLSKSLSPGVYSLVVNKGRRVNQQKLLVKP